MFNQSVVLPVHYLIHFFHVLPFGLFSLFVGVQWLQALLFKRPSKRKMSKIKHISTSVLIWLHVLQSVRRDYVHMCPYMWICVHSDLLWTDFPFTLCILCSHIHCEWDRKKSMYWRWMRELFCIITELGTKPNVNSSLGLNMCSKQTEILIWVGFCKELA